jgi:glutathione-regulated potassium-efflux system protein KefB
MLQELLPMHNAGKQFAIRNKEARKELEEIFGREMEKDDQARDEWDRE